MRCSLAFLISIIIRVGLRSRNGRFARGFRKFQQDQEQDQEGSRRACHVETSKPYKASCEKAAGSVQDQERSKGIRAHRSQKNGRFARGFRKKRKAHSAFKDKASRQDTCSMLAHATTYLGRAWLTARGRKLKHSAFKKRRARQDACYMLIHAANISWQGFGWH